jgi:hypothetical protein
VVPSLRIAIRVAVVAGLALGGLVALSHPVAAQEPAAGELLPLLPHEPEGQPGSAIDGLAILGSVIDSTSGRGVVALSLEEGQSIASAVEARGLSAVFCGSDCPGRYGDAAVTFHLPRIEGDEANVRIRTYWAIGQLPSLPPDRVLFRADELRLRRTEGAWGLVGHEKLSEEIKQIAVPMPTVVE